MTREELMDAAEEEGLLLADGFDNCIIGIVQVFNKTAILYDQVLVLKQLVKEGMSWDSAREFFEFNIVGAYVGDATPGFAQLLEKEEFQNEVDNEGKKDKEA